MNLVRLAATIAVLSLAFTGAAGAQAYPIHPVTIIVPTGAGGGMDMVARLIATKLEQQLGKPFVVENRPGAGSNIGASAVARSSPDGYTLLIASSSTMAINASVYKSMPFDPQKDLIPVALYARVPFVAVVNASSPVKSIRDLIHLAKENPGKLTFGSSGTGTASHLFAELFRMHVGVEVTHVPYKSMVQPLNDLLGGHLDYMLSDLAPALPLIRSGKLRALGVTSITRVPEASDIPTLAEAGVTGYEAEAWLMLVARAGTPPDVLSKLHGAVKDILSLADVREAISQAGYIPQEIAPLEELRQYVSSETRRWADIVRKAGAAGIE